MKLLFYLLIIFLIIIRFITTRPIYHEGDKVRITAQVLSLSRIAGLKIKFPSFPEVQYGNYVVVEGVVQKGELTDIEIKDLRVSNNIFVTLRKKIVEFYNTSLPPIHASLIAGIVLGAKSDLDKNFYNKLINTGTSHIVVASGMNLTLTAGFVMLILLNFVKRRKAIFITLIVILIYCYIVGFEAPIVRAAIMTFFAFLAQLLGRVANTLRILFLTGFIMLFINPTWLSDIGFVLSFSTTFSMILFEKKISSLLHSVPNLFRESLSTSLSAQILASPIILFAFGRINLLSPFINALILWTVAPIMIIGSISGLIGIVFQPLGKLVVLLAYPLTAWFIFVINIFG